MPRKRLSHPWWTENWSAATWGPQPAPLLTVGLLHALRTPSPAPPGWSPLSTRSKEGRGEVSRLGQASQRAGPDQAEGALAFQVCPGVPGPPHSAAAVEAARTGDPGPAVGDREPPGGPTLPYPAGSGWASSREVSSIYCWSPACPVPVPTLTPSSCLTPKSTAKTAALTLALIFASSPCPYLALIPPPPALKKLIYCKATQTLIPNMSVDAEPNLDATSSPDLFRA